MTSSSDGACPGRVTKQARGEADVSFVLSPHVHAHFSPPLAPPRRRAAPRPGRPPLRSGERRSGTGRPQRQAALWAQYQAQRDRVQRLRNSHAPGLRLERGADDSGEWSVLRKRPTISDRRPERVLCVRQLRQQGPEHRRACHRVPEWPGARLHHRAEAGQYHPPAVPLRGAEPEFVRVVRSDDGRRDRLVLLPQQRRRRRGRLLSRVPADGPGASPGQPDPDVEPGRRHVALYRGNDPRRRVGVALSWDHDLRRRPVPVRGQCGPPERDPPDAGRRRVHHRHPDHQDDLPDHVSPCCRELRLGRELAHARVRARPPGWTSPPTTSGRRG